MTHPCTKCQALAWSDGLGGRPLKHLYRCATCGHEFFVRFNPDGTRTAKEVTPLDFG